MVNNGFYFRAIPDSGVARVAFDPRGEPAPIWPNVISLSDMHKQYLMCNSDVVWAGTKSKYDTSSIRWIVNSLADVDEYKNSLNLLDHFSQSGIPIFNHPRALINTRRDIIVGKIKNLKYIDVPKCIRINADNRLGFVEDVKKSGIGFPLMIRPEKSQTGQGLMVFENENELVSYADNLDINCAYYITEFLNTVQDNGLYYKARIIIVGSNYFFRHIKVSQNRIVHRGSSEVDYSWNEEKKCIDYLLTNDQLISDIKEIISSIGLDYFGVDIGIDRSRNRCVFFEANPAMLVFLRDKKNENLLKTKRRKALQDPINKKLMDLLKSPKSWVSMSRNFDEEFMKIYTKS